MRTIVVTCLLCVGLLAGCGREDHGDGTGVASGSITVYAGRKGDVVEPIVAKFNEATGIDVTIVQNKNGAKLLSQLEAEAEAKKAAKSEALHAEIRANKEAKLKREAEVRKQMQVGSSPLPPARCRRMHQNRLGGGISPPTLTLPLSVYLSPTRSGTSPR